MCQCRYVIGNLTSQFFADLYLNEMDYFAKHKPKAKHHIRYVDDFVILLSSKLQLEFWKQEINTFLQENLKLELHPDKSKVYPLCKGTKFLGFRVFYYYKLLNKRNIAKMRGRIEQFRQEYKNGKISAEYIQRSLNSWIGYAQYANTHGLRQSILHELGNF